MQAKVTVGVFGIIFDEAGRVLLCHRIDHDFWNLPGGQMDDGETPWDGVVREIREETGLEAEIVRLVGVYSKPDKADLVFVYLCRVIGGEITLNAEADRIEYFALAELPANTLPKHIERIHDAAAGHEQPLMIVQTGPSPINHS